MSDFKLQIGEQPYEFNVARQGKSFHVEWNGRLVECRLFHRDGSKFVLEVVDSSGARSLIHAAAAASGDQRQLWVDGRTVTYQRLRRRGAAAGLEGALASSIPAVVSEILVAPGDRVSSGDKLILLESMKMIIPIQAPFPGRIAALHCSEGASVAAGVQLIELTREEGNP